MSRPGRTAHPLREPLAAAEPRRILFLRIDRIGDMVLTLPALRALKRRFSRAELTVLASPSNQTLIRREPGVDRVQVLQSGNARLAHLVTLLPKLRRARFDLVIDPMPEGDPLTLLLALGCGAARRIGFAGRLRSRLYDAVLPAPPAGRHFRDLTCDLVRALGARADPGAARPVLAPADVEQAGKWFADHGLANAEVIGIHPGGHYPSQRWPLEHHAALIGLLHEKRLGRVLLLGGESEAPLIAEICRRSRIAPPVFVSRDLGGTAAVLARCRLFLGNNSGPLHLAAALGVPTVSFRGPTRAGRWTPLGSGHRVLERAGLDCLGCERGLCPRGSHECLAGISPHEALAALEELWRSGRP